MKARGKRRAERGASPLVPYLNNGEALKERNNNDDISHFQCSLQLLLTTQGRRASRLPLAIIFRAVGAARPDSRRWRCPTRFAPLALPDPIRAVGAAPYPIPTFRAKLVL